MSYKGSKMKLRIRLGRRNERIEISKEATVHDLKLKIASCFNVSCDSFKLSLNGKDAISAADTSPLSVLELVSGDLLKLISEDELASSGPQRETPSASENTPNERLVPEGAQVDGVTPDNSGMTENSTHRADVQQIEKKLPKEPMLIRDCSSSKLTHRLWEVWKEGSPQSVSEGLSLVLHGLMLETGFQVYSAEKSDGPSNTSSADSMSVESSHLLPPSWRQFGCCRFSYVHQQCNQSHICHLACVPLGSVVSVTGIVGNDSRESFSLQISPEEYVTDWKKTLSLCNTAKLSRIFKDAIAHPMLYNLKESSGFLPSHGFLALAMEIQVKILSSLDLRSLLNVSQVCQTLHGLSQDETVWRLLCLTDLKLKDKSQNNCATWKQAYEKQYKQNLDRRKAEAWRRDIRMNYQPNFTPVKPQYFPGGYQPGVRGGDYDRDPFPVNPFQQRRPDMRAFQPMRPRHDPIFHDPDLDPQPGAGRGLRDGPSRGNFGLRRGGGRLGSFGSGGPFFP